MTALADILNVARFIALGATGVLIGRATLYGVAIGGAQGAARVLELLTQERGTVMGMLGARRLDELRARRSCAGAD